MTAIKEFEEIYGNNKNFDFDYEKQIIHFNNSQSKKEKFLLGLFMTSFFVIMLQVANWGNFSLSFLIYSILIGIFISLFSLIGKNEFEIDFANKTFNQKSLLSKKELKLSDIEDIKFVKSYLNFTFINYRIEFITKKGKLNYHFLSERNKTKTENILKWSQKHLQLN